ncbi:hypothetical protein Sste5344_006767 [Sporothrix stenoceras]
MSARLEEHMRIRRQFQACGAKRLGPILPDGILDQFTAAVTADDRDAVRALLDTHFPDRTELFPSQYNIHELFPVISQAARNDQADVLKELFVPYPFPYQSTDFVAREAIDTDRDMVIWLIAHGASLNERPRYVDITGMSQAVQHTSLDLVRELSRTQSGTQSVAAASDIVEMLGLLLERGAPLNLTLYADDEVSSYKYRNSDHGTPLHEAALAWAEKAGHEDVAAMLRSPDQYKL